jgi:hypothetical protein
MTFFELGGYRWFQLWPDVEGHLRGCWLDFKVHLYEIFHLWFLHKKNLLHSLLQGP